MDKRSNALGWLFLGSCIVAPWLAREFLWTDDRYRWARVAIPATIVTVLLAGKWLWRRRRGEATH